MTFMHILMSILSASFGSGFSSEISLSQCLSFILLLLICNTFKSEEIFTTLLIKFLLDISDSEFDSGDNHILKGIHTTICDFNNLIQCDELSLKRGDLDQVLEEFLEAFSAFLDCLTTTSQTKHCSIIRVSGSGGITSQ